MRKKTIETVFNETVNVPLYHAYKNIYDKIEIGLLISS